jgi:hypothetical protein
MPPFEFESKPASLGLGDLLIHSNSLVTKKPNGPIWPESALAARTPPSRASCRFYSRRFRIRRCSEPSWLEPRIAMEPPEEVPETEGILLQIANKLD